MLNLTPFLKFYADRRVKTLTSQSAAKVQEAQLLQLLKKASKTLIGRQYGFSRLRTVGEYQSVVPLRTYEDFWNEYWHEPFPTVTDCTWPGTIPYFAVTSGTTSGTTKYIPYTPDMGRSNQTAGLDLLVHHLQNKPNSRIFAGKTFMLGGSTELVRQTEGIYSGDLSGIAANTLPWWAALRFYPPKELALLSDWEEKIDRLARESLNETITCLSGVPSWLLIFFAKLKELRPDSGGVLKTIYPELEMLVHGGVNFAPYQQQFSEFVADTQIDLREVYPASEGFIAIADKSYGEGLRLILDHEIFYEFVPVSELNSEEPTRHWVKDVELGENYAIVLTSCAGVWSYILGDTVKFVSKDPPRVLVTGRTSYTLSAFGEHLIGDEIEDAVATAADAINNSVIDFSVGPIFPSNSEELGGHIFIVEFAEAVPDPNTIAEFEAIIDQRLSERNEDYEAHRAEGYGLNPPRVSQASSGAFSAWMKSRGKLGGQHKVPRIINDQKLLKNLQDFVDNYTS